MFRRSLTPKMHSCAGGVNCPDILELDTGDFAVIGTNITSKEVRRNLPDGSGCSQDEIIIQIPRNTLIQAKENIPDS